MNTATTQATKAQTATCHLLDESMAECLSAVADRNRMQMLLLLGEQGRLCVGEIASHFRISRPAISHHLKVLKNAQIVDREKAGQEMYYWVDLGSLVGRLRGLADLLEQCTQPTP